MVSWILLAVLYPFCFSIVNLIDKFLVEKKVKNYMSYSVIVGIILLISALIVIGFAGIPSVSAWVLFIAIIAGSAYGLVYLNYFYMLRDVEVSRIIGVGYLFPVFVAILSRIFLGEQLSMLKYGAILVAVIGTVFLSIERKQQRFRMTRAFWLMLFNAFLLGIVDVGDKYVVGFVSYWQAYALTSIPLAVVIMLPSFKQTVRKDLAQAAKVLPGILLAEIITILGAIVFLAAAAMGPIAITSALGTLQAVFVLLLTLFSSLFVPHLLKEVITPGVLMYKIIGIACVVLGAVILSL